MKDNQLLARLQIEKMAVKKIKVLGVNDTMIRVISETCSEISCSHCSQTFMMAVGPREAYVTRPQEPSKAQRRNSAPVIRQTLDIAIPDKIKRYVEVIDRKLSHEPAGFWSDTNIDEFQIMFGGFENPFIGHYVAPLLLEENCD